MWNKLKQACKGRLCLVIRKVYAWRFNYPTTAQNSFKPYLKKRKMLFNTNILTKCKDLEIQQSPHSLRLERGLGIKTRDFHMNMTAREGHMSSSH